MSAKFFVILCAQIKKLQDLGLIYIYIYVTNMNKIRNFVIYTSLIKCGLKILAIGSRSWSISHYPENLFFFIKYFIFSVINLKAFYG
jgi:hypothetical protein